MNDWIAAAAVGAACLAGFFGGMVMHDVLAALWKRWEGKR